MSINLLMRMIVSKLIFIGCMTRSFSKLWKTFQNISIGFGVALLVSGVFLTFFGAKY